MTRTRQFLLAAMAAILATGLAQAAMAQSAQPTPHAPPPAPVQHWVNQMNELQW